MFELRHRLMEEAGTEEESGGGGGISTVLGTEEQPGGGNGNATEFPEDWRDQMVGHIEGLDDDGKTKATEQLGRFQHPGDLFKSFREAQDKIAQGPKPLADDATPEDLKAFREANGIPLEIKGYFDAVDKDLIQEADKGMFEDMFEHIVHKHNMKPEVANDVAKWYYDMQESQTVVLQEADEDHKKTAEDALRADWGSDYRRNINIVNAALGRIPEEARETFTNARGPDGVALLNNPDILKFLVGLQSAADPSSTVVGTEGAGGLETVEEEIKSIEKDMRTNRAEYNKDEKKQERYRELITIRDKMKAGGK